MKQLLAFMALVLGASAAAGAEKPDERQQSAEIVSESPPSGDKRNAGARFAHPEDGKLDFSSHLENPRGFLPVPIVVTEPAVGYGGGGAGMFLRPRKEAGAEGWARPDISVVGAFATENGTWGGFAGDASRWQDGRLRTLAGIGAGEFNLDFYGLGPTLSSLDQKVHYELSFFTAVAQANWQLAPKSPWAIGLRYVYADVNPKLRDESLFPGLSDRVRAKISAPALIVEFDSRDNVFTPKRGIYAEFSWFASRKTLGATDDFERLQQVLTIWQPIRRDVTLGARAYYTRSSSATPFFLRPYVELRGVPAMRYQGDQAASVEVEVQWQFFGRWTALAFGGLGTTRTDHDRFAATQNVGAVGAGFRYELARKFGLHAGLDIAHSPGTTAVYLQVGSAWFRP